MADEAFEGLQREFERILSEIRTSQSADEKRALLREFRKLLDEADLRAGSEK